MARPEPRRVVRIASENIGGAFFCYSDDLMKKLRLAEVQPLVDLWVERLGLQRFEIVVEVGDAEENNLALTSFNGEGSRAKIVFHEDFYKRDGLGPPGLERTVIHELGHVMLAELDFSITDALDALGGNSPAGKAYSAAIRQHEELLCDRLATALVRAWP